MIKKQISNTLIRRRLWRCQRGNQNSQMEDEKTTQWPKEKVQKNIHIKLKIQ